MCARGAHIFPISHCAHRLLVRASRRKRAFPTTTLMFHTPTATQRRMLRVQRQTRSLRSAARQIKWTKVRILDFEFRHRLRKRSSMVYFKRSRCFLSLSFSLCPSFFLQPVPSTGFVRRIKACSTDYFRLTF